MAGAIAGTAILHTDGLTHNLHTVTITINNKCNLNCPHCYLQYKSNKELLGEKTIDSVLKSNFKHLAIVGKEPLYDDESIRLLESLIEKSKNKNKTVSFVTNGLNLNKLSVNTIRLVDYIDISFSANPTNSEKFRIRNFLKIINGIDYLYDNGAKEINALFTLHDHNVDIINEMIAINEYAIFSKIMFSPYLITDNHGSNFVESVSILYLLDLLKDSQRFIGTHNVLLLLDVYHLKQENLDIKKIKEKIVSLGLNEKVKLIDYDPLFYGIIRVTFDDLVLNPEISLHTKKYSVSQYNASFSDLNAIYQKFRLMQ